VKESAKLVSSEIWGWMQGTPAISCVPRRLVSYIKPVHKMSAGE